MTSNLDLGNNCTNCYHARWQEGKELPWGIETLGDCNYPLPKSVVRVKITDNRTGGVLVALSGGNQTTGENCPVWQEKNNDKA
jgi:hypothetical protein